MLYAEVVLGLPVEGPFDYIVPKNHCKKIKAGARVWVPFGSRRMLGFAVKLKSKTKIKKLKPIFDVIDDLPVLNEKMLILTKELSDYYCCSWGEAIETALPEGLRRGKPIRIHPQATVRAEEFEPEAILIHEPYGQNRWEIYFAKIKETLDKGKSAIILLPRINSVLNAKDKINLKFGFYPQVLYRKQGAGLDEWGKAKEGKNQIIIGTRSCVFAPLDNLGLIIIDEEQDSAYKQEQSPHYNAREIALIRMDIEKTKLILGSSSPSLESFYLAKTNKIKYFYIAPNKDFPEIKIIDMKNLSLVDKKSRMIISRYLSDSILSALNQREKVLLFFNRKGFATSASCHRCGVVFKCQRCNINLVYHFKDNLLRCRYCNFKMAAPQICPNCNSGYIRYSGAGTEKLESEFARLFPSAKIKLLDKGKEADIEDADLFISTKFIIGKTNYNFSLTGVLSIDNSLNYPDFRATEKNFALLIGLLGLTKKKLIIQTSLPNHYFFQALANKNINMFYNEELKQREGLNFPPYQHIALIKLRGRNEERVKEASGVLFERLSESSKNKKIKIISVNPAEPAKLRGNFYWQILIKSDDARRMSGFLKKRLKVFSYSGIIVTVDIDPI